MSGRQGGRGRAGRDTATKDNEVELDLLNALPDAWNMNQWHGSEYHLTPEKNADGSPSGTATGAALWLYQYL